MNIEIINLAPMFIAILSLLISILTLWISALAFSRGKKTELFTLRQRVLLEAERARSAWYVLGHENNSLIHQVQQNSALCSQQKNIALEFLRDQGEHLALCIRDACAMADDVQKNVDKFNQKKCEEYLRTIEPSIEKLVRNHGVSQQKLTELMEQFSQP